MYIGLDAETFVINKQEKKDITEYSLISQVNKSEVINCSCRFFIQTWSEYTDSCTLHGVPYIKSDNRWYKFVLDLWIQILNFRCDRILWMIVVFIALVSSIYFSATAYR